MTLREWLNESGKQLTAVAVELKISPSRLHGYVSGARRPPVDIVAQVEELTGGKVRAADFVAASSRGVDAAQPSTVEAA